MPRHSEKRRVPYSSDQMFALVAAVERYPEFLPWCLEANVFPRRGDLLSADLVVGNKLFRETFSSDVTLEAPKRIVVDYVGGPLSRLATEWSFCDLQDGGCEIGFFVDFALKSSVLNALMEVFFDKAFRHMVEAFEKRAGALYGTDLV